MNVLVVCESSGTVRNAFRSRGHNAWSCDLLPADDASPYHFEGDCFEYFEVFEPDGSQCPNWDLIIAHPPCTHIAISGSSHFEAKKKDGRFQQGVQFFKDIIKACQLHSTRYCVENPVCVMSSLYMKPTQIIQPWQFGHNASKKTCLWLGNLPPLKPTNIVQGRMVDGVERFDNQCDSGQNKLSPSADRWKIRSKTYQGFADAMAEQWSNL